MGMDTSCGNKISLSKLFLFFFFQAFINVLDFLQHQFHVFLQALNLAGDVGHQCISLLGRRIQEAKVVFVGLDVVFQPFVSANQAFTVAVEISFFVAVSAYTAQAFFSSRQVQAVEQLVYQCMEFFIQTVFFLERNEADGIPLLHQGTYLFGSCIVCSSGSFQGSHTLNDIFFLGQVFHFFRAL